MENINRLLLGLLLVSRLIYYDILINISEIVCSLALHRQRAQGPLVEQGRKPPELNLSKFEPDEVDEATFFHVLRFWPSREAFIKGVKFMPRGENLSLCCIIALLFIENPNMNKINIAI